MNSFGQPSSANMNLNNIGPVTYISHRPILVSPTPISAVPSGQVFHNAANQQNMIHTYANGSVAAAPAIISSGQHQNISIQTAARPAYSIIQQAGAPGGHQAIIRSSAIHPINVSFHQPSTAINSIVNSAQAASRQNIVQNVNGLPVIQVSPQGQAMAQHLANTINVHQKSNRSPAMYPTFNPMNTGFHAEPIRKTEANQSINNIDKEPDSPENEKSIEERAKAWAAKNSTPIQGEESHTSSKLPKLSGPPPGFEPNKNENSESVTNNNVNKNKNEVEVVESEKENFNEEKQQQHIQTKTDQQASKASENAAKIPQKSINSKILNETDQKTIVQNQTAENAIPSPITTNILPTNTSSNNINSKQPIPISHNGGQPNIINLGNQISKIRQQLPGSLPIVRMQPVQISKGQPQLYLPAQHRGATIGHFPPHIRTAQPTAIINQQPVQQIGIPMIIPGQLVPLHPGVPPPAYTQMTHQSHQGAMVGTSSGFYQSIPGHNNQNQQFISPVGPLIVNNRPRFVTLNVSSINTNNRTGVNFSSSNNINNNNNNFVHNNGVIQPTTNTNINNNNNIKIKNNNNNYNTLPPNIFPIENSQVKLLSSSPIDSEMSVSTATSATNSYNIKVRPIALRTGYELESQKTSKQTSDNQERSIFDLEDQKEINQNHSSSKALTTTTTDNSIHKTSDYSPYKLRLPLSNQMSSENNTTASQNTMPSLFDTIDDTDDNENENSESLSAMFSRTNSSSKSANNQLIRDTINADSCVKLVNLDKNVTKNGENGEPRNDLSIFDS